MNRIVNASVRLCWFGLVLAVAGCIGVNATDTAGAGFRIASVLPEADDALPTLDAAVAIIFTADVDPKTITVQSVKVMDMSSHQAVLGKVTYESRTRTARFAPIVAWSPEGHYKATVHHRVQSDVGKKHLPATFTWEFDAPVAPPTTLHLEPADGEVDVSPKSLVTVLFSDSMDATTITSNSFRLFDASGVVVPATVTAPLDGDAGHEPEHETARPTPRPVETTSGHAILTPKAELKPNTQYTAKLTAEIKSASGVSFASREWKFTVSAGRSSTLLIGSDQDDAITSVAESGGEIYALGVTQGALPKANSAGQQDVFLAKRDLSGRELWTTQFGGAGNDSAGAFLVADDGIIVVVGSNEPGVIVGQRVKGPPAVDGVLFQLSPTGKLDKTVQLGAVGNFAGVSNVISDGAGNLFVSGSFDGRLGTKVSQGGSDAFLAKYDANLDRAWLEIYGTAGTDGGGTLVLGKSGEIFWLVSTDGDFNAPAEAPAAPRFKSMLFKIDPQTRRVEPGWPIDLGGDTRTVASIGIDGSGTLFVGGLISGDQSSATVSGLFLAKVDAVTGVILDSRERAVDNSPQFITMAIQSNGQVYLAGLVEGVGPPEIGPDGTRFEPRVINAYVTKIDFETEQGAVWSRSLVSKGYAMAGYVAVQSTTADVVVVGNASGSFDGQIPMGDSDGFIAWLDAIDGTVK